MIIEFYGEEVSLIESLVVSCRSVAVLRSLKQEQELVGPSRVLIGGKIEDERRAVVDRGRLHGGRNRRGAEHLLQRGIRR